MGKMHKTQKFGQAVGILIFGLSILIGTAFNLRVAYAYLDLLSFWGYPEVIPYDYSADNGEFSPSGFHCPQLLTPGETKEVAIRITNKSDQLIQPIIQILASEPGYQESYTRLKEEFTLQPGETKEFTQALSADSSLIAYDIKVRIFLALNRELPASMTRHCPVMVYQVGDLTGTQILVLLSAVTLVLSLSGIGLFWRYSSNEIRRNRLSIKWLVGVAVFMGISMLLNLLELYFLALMCILAGVFLALALFESNRMDAIFK